MIQDLQKVKLNNQFRNVKPDKDADILIYQRKEVLLRKESETCVFPRYGELEENIAEEAFKNMEFHYGFTIGEKIYFLLDGLKVDVYLEGYEYVPLHKTRQMQPKECIFAAATGWHLALWYRNNRFCGVCGKYMAHDSRERMVKCPNCGNQVYPKIQPAVIVGVRNGDYLLMTKYAGRTYKKYALIAGFTEIGETVEETVAREVYEEVGLRIKNITYYKSQPWGFDGDLLLGYFCDVDGDTSILLDRDELSLGEWVHRKDIPEYTEDLSLTGEMMNYFRSGNI